MDYKRIRETKQKLAHYDARLETLIELQRETEEKRQEVCDNCSHDFVLAYGTDKTGEKIAGCLVCGQYLNINDELIDSFSEVQLDKESVLDVSNETSLFSQRLSKNNKSVLLLKAEEVFNEYCKINTMCYSREMILKDIYYKVLELDEYYVNQEKMRKQNYEEELTKKKK